MTTASAQASHHVQAPHARVPPQPDRDVRRLHRLVDDGPQVGAQPAELDLSPEPRAERARACAARRSGGGRSAGRRAAARRARSGRNSAATTSVDTAIARFEPPANDENTACPASTSPA